MDKASQALAKGLPASVPRSYRAIADHSGVPRSTLHCRAKGQRSIEEKAQSQQHLKPFEERAMTDFILQISDLGTPVRIKYTPSLAFSVARHRPESNRPLKPPGKNWAKALQKRHPELQARKFKVLDWDRHEKNIIPKIEHWFEVIGQVLADPNIKPENVYSMDETGVMLSKLGSVKVLVGKNDMRDYRDARVKRKMVTVTECISADAYRDSVERLERGGVNAIGKEHFTFLYSCARESAFTKRNIAAGWSKGGLFPLNPSRVLKDLERPFARLVEASGGPAAQHTQDIVTPLATAPLTLVTPVSAFTSLQDSLLGQDALTLDDIDRRRFERRIQKLTKAAQTSCARNALQEDHLRFLLKINDESKARRSTRSIVLGTARVMSFEDLEEAKAKRAEQQENSKFGKGKQSRSRKKRKSANTKGCKPVTSLEAEVPGGVREAASNSVQQVDLERVRSPVAPHPIAPCPGKAPTAHMY
ncbi:hypothetical protein NU195Hw_Modified_186t2 [Hortaea werneckii]